MAILSPWIEAYREEAAYRLREEEEDLDQEILRAQQVRGGMIMGDSAEPEILRDIREALSRSQNPLPFN